MRISTWIGLLLSMTLLSTGCGDDGMTVMDAGGDGGPTDGDGGGGFKVIHECDEGSFVDRSGGGADRTVAFGGSLGNAYDPQCMQISSGQEVTFEGDMTAVTFSAHPLRPDTAPSRSEDPDGSPGNPITATDTGNTASFTFDSTGVFPYYCDFHHGSGMYGVIHVTE